MRYATTPMNGTRTTRISTTPWPSAEVLAPEDVDEDAEQQKQHSEPEEQEEHRPEQAEDRIVIRGHDVTALPKRPHVAAIIVTRAVGLRRDAPNGCVRSRRRSDVRCSCQVVGRRLSRWSAASASVRVSSPAGISRARLAAWPDHSDVKLVSPACSAAARSGIRRPAALGKGGTSSLSGPASRINQCDDARAPDDQ